MKNILLFILASILCIHCENECLNDNIKLGTVSLDQKTLDFIDVYEEKETVSFSSFGGDIKMHQIERQESTNPRLCVKVICRPSYEVGGENGCEYYEAEERSYTLTSEDLILRVKAGMEVFEPDTEDYYEFIEVSMSNSEESYSAGFISSTNFAKPESISNSILGNGFVTKLVTENSDYTKVMEYTFGGEDIYLVYKRGKGITNYSIGNTKWTLIE